MQHARKRLDDVARDEAGSLLRGARRELLRGARCGGGALRLHPFRQERGRDPCEDVACSGGRQ